MGNISFLFHKSDLTQSYTIIIKFAFENIGILIPKKRIIFELKR